MIMMQVEVCMMKSVSGTLLSVTHMGDCDDEEGGKRLYILH
jgi:hypothetical protein